jgi:hypothetical protein
MMARDSRFTASPGHIRERCLMLYYIQFVEPIYGDAYDRRKTVSRRAYRRAVSAVADR